MSKNQGGDLAVYVKNTQEAMSSQNYNEMDGIVFAEMTYMKFESDGVNWAKSELEDGISVQAFAQKMLDHKSKCGINSEQQALLKSIINSDRYKDCKIRDLAACEGTQMWNTGQKSRLPEDSQWGAMTIDINDGSNSSVIAMRGTNGTSLGWEEDFELGYEAGGTTAQRLSRDYLKAADADHIYLTGHSKGGNDVSSAYMMSEKDIRDRVVRVDNYDGPGHNDEFIDEYSEAYQELKGKQNNYYPQDSLIGLLLHNNPGTQIFFRSDMEGHTEDASVLGEHDPFSFVLEDDGDGNYQLKRTKQSELSKSIDRTLDSYLGGLSSGEKERVLNALIHLGIPALIAKDGKGSSELDYSNWQSLLLSAIQYPYTSPEEAWATLMTIRGLLICASEYGYLKFVDFRMPGVSEFYYMIRDCWSDFFRKYKNAAEEKWDRFVSFVRGKSPEKTATKSSKSATVYDFGSNRQGGRGGVAKFKVIPSALKRNIERMEQCQRQLSLASEEISRINSNLNLVGKFTVRRDLKSVAGKVQKDADAVKKMGKALQNIVTKYETTERNIAGYRV